MSRSTALRHASTVLFLSALTPAFPASRASAQAAPPPAAPVVDADAGLPADAGVLYAAPLVADRPPPYTTSVDAGLVALPLNAGAPVLAAPTAYEPQPVVAAPVVAPPASKAADDEDELSTVVVSGRRIKKDGTLADRPSESVYGTDTPLVDTPRSVSQISNRQFQQDVIRSADDLIRYAPGITFGGGQNVNLAPQVRGQNSEILQDGQRIYNVRHPSNLNAYEGADVVAGAAPVMFGPVGASGGYVNYVTKKPRFNEKVTQISGNVGTLAPRGDSFKENRLTVDTNQHVGKKFAYRASYTLQRNSDFYDNVQNKFNAYYGALAYQPLSNLRIDWNASYDDYYDFNITHGWNRITQKLVDSYGKKYDAGRATPIIESPGVGLWSPVFASGAADSAVVGWQARAGMPGGQFLPTGPINNGPLPNATADKPGTIRGWVYDPSLPGNGVRSISPTQGHRAADRNTASRFQTQSNINLKISAHTALNNKFLISRSADTTNSVGSFLSQSWDNMYDDRLELRNRAAYEPFAGLKIKHDANTGVSFRREEFVSLAANNNFNINPYDLTQPSANKTPGGLLGLPTKGTSGSWIGQPGVPQQSSFGFINIPAMYPAGGLYAEKGGSPPNASYTAKGWWNTTTFYTQQNFMFDKYVGLNAGFNNSYLKAHIENPLVLNPATDRYSDERSYRLTSLQLSPLVKPTEHTTLYFTFDRSTSLNTGGFANVLPWGPNNKLNPQTFGSISKLFEGGAKADVIPGLLYASLAGYWSARDQSPDINGNMARLEVRGVEAAVRAEPLKNLRTGLNLSWIDAKYTYIVPAGFSPYGFAPDNGTVWGDRNAVNKRTGTKYDAAGIPDYSLTGYVDYQLDLGLGAQLIGWVTSDWYVNLSQTVKVPTQYNLDLNVYYRQPKWDITAAITNLTDAKNFVNGLAGSATEFLQPMRPFTAQARGSIRF